MKKLFIVSLLAFALTACGSKVEVPPAHVGKIMTKDGYQPNTIPPSKFRLSPCWSYCDKLILLDASDKTVEEPLSIFMPTDKLNLKVGVRVTLSLNPAETSKLFTTLAPTTTEDGAASIEWANIYRTYAQQIILTQTREYLSKYTIEQVASSLERVNADLSAQLSKIITARTPFNVRAVGITNIQYPEIIAQAQENAAKRREQIQQEEAELQVSQVRLERELKEAQLQRSIEAEKAKTEADAQRVLAASVDQGVLALRKLENDRALIDKWNGQLPVTSVTGEGANILSLPVPKQ